MTIERAYAVGWGMGEMLTSAQMNTVDANTAAALDRRAGKGDILMSTVVATGTGRIISSVATGPDSNTTFHPVGGNQIVRIPTLTAARTYTVGHTGATGGDRMIFYIEGTGPTASGYVDILNNAGTGLARLGRLDHSTPQLTLDADSAELLFNGSTWQLLRRSANPGMRAIEFTSTGFWLCPDRVYSVLLHGYGGGGGGAGGNTIVPTSPYIGLLACGGGGGAGAQADAVRVAVTPGVLYAIGLGMGGGAGGAGVAGSPGGNTTFGPASGAALAIFKGAGGGYVGTNSLSTGIYCYAKGGVTVAPPISVNSYPTINCLATGMPQFWTGWFGPGWGGNGVTVTVPTALAMNAGMGSVQGYSGGVAGVHGTSLDYLFGGGGGGGGGGGPGGPGGPGGTGGAGAVGTGLDGLTPTGVAANTGAGGGGGGAGGNSDLVQGNGATGVAGGSGKLTIVVVK